MYVRKLRKWYQVIKVNGGESSFLLMQIYHVYQYKRDFGVCFNEYEIYPEEEI